MKKRIKILLLIVLLGIISLFSYSCKNKKIPTDKMTQYENYLYNVKEHHNSDSVALSDGWYKIVILKNEYENYFGEKKLTRSYKREIYLYAYKKSDSDKLLNKTNEYYDFIYEENYENFILTSVVTKKECFDYGKYVQEKQIEYISYNDKNTFTRKGNNFCNESLNLNIGFAWSLLKPSSFIEGYDIDETIYEYYLTEIDNRYFNIVDGKPVVTLVSCSNDQNRIETENIYLNENYEFEKYNYSSIYINESGSDEVYKNIEMYKIDSYSLKNIDFNYEEECEEKVVVDIYE